MFVGSTILDVPLDGNPWSWDNNTWNLIDDFDISRDFPTIEVLQEQIPSVMLDLCFRHKNKSDHDKELNEMNYHANNKSYTQSSSSQANKNSNSFNNNEYEDVADEMYDNLYNPNNELYSKNSNKYPSETQEECVEQEKIDVTNKNNMQRVKKNYYFQELKRILPETPNNVLISEVLKTIANSLTTNLSENNLNFKNSETYKVNKNTIRKLLNMLSSEDGVHFKLMCTSCLPLLVIEDKLTSQVSQINDVVRLIRHHSSSPDKSLMYIKMNNSEFDNSQGSIVVHRYRSAD